MTMEQSPARYDLILAGGGHAHALTLRMLAMSPLADTRVTLVSPQSLTPYSGMLPGLIAGHYQFDETHIDLVQLCQKAGVRFVRQAVCHVDTTLNRLRLSDGTELDYDWLSLDIGSAPDLDGVPGAEEYATPVKPVSGFYSRWQDFLDRLDETMPQDRHLQLLVVGGGAGGTELVLAMAHALKRRGYDNVRLHLITEAHLLPGYPPLVRRAMRHALDNYQITLHTDQRVLAVQPGSVRTISQSLPFDELFWCTGARGKAWLAETALKTNADRFIEVDDYLRSTSHQNVFAAGDCAWQVSRPAPRAGVYAVRQARILAHNLRAAIAGTSLRTFRPQRKFLSLLSAGGKYAAGARDPVSMRGEWVWRLKHRIDTGFMRQFEQLPARMPPRAQTPAREQPRCAGCGAKVGNNALRNALIGLKPVHHGDILSGVDQREDASVIRWQAGALLVQSQDYLPAFVDDPYLFGRITALHSLSDVHARNAQPHSALATVSLPVNHPRLQSRDLTRLMQGAVEELNRAECALLGGHTVEGPQLAAGFSINGVGDKNTLLGKGGARPGDMLILSKSLGVGIVLAALMQGRRIGSHLDDALASMLVGNGSAARIFSQHRARAMTDITGFGLLGHLLELCDASGVSAQLEAEAVPVLSGVISLVANGIQSTLKESNDAALTRCQLAPHLLDHPLLTVLTDPQTSGGLLAAVPAERATRCLQALDRAGQQGWIIGTVEQSMAPTITLR